MELEYSPSKDVAFCFSCCLSNKPTMCARSWVIIIDGFLSWKNVKDGQNYASLSHIGKYLNTLYKKVIMQSHDLMNQAQHI